MEIISGLCSSSIAGSAHTSVDTVLSVVESPVLGKSKRKRVTSTCKSAHNNQVVSVLVEEYEGKSLFARQFEQFLPYRSSTKEVFEPDGSLVSSETERWHADELVCKIIVRGSGKSSTTRIIFGEIEARATERSIMIESPSASYNYQIFEGKWSSFYKEIDLKLELKANFLKNPDSILKGPDGINLVFKAGRLIDLIVTNEVRSSLNKSDSSVLGILE